MIERTTIRSRWRLSFYAAAGAVVAFVPLVIASEIGIILYPVIGLVLLVCVACARGRRLLFLLMLVVHCAVSFALCQNYDGIHTALRWFLWSRNFKTEVLAQPDRSDGEWKHVEWDGWGFAGAGNTVVYLVFNPSNSLAEAARTHSSGVVFTPTPRVVPHVRRLENSWYSVVFYTQTDWRHGD